MKVKFPVSCINCHGVFFKILELDGQCLRLSCHWCGAKQSITIGEPT